MGGTRAHQRGSVAIATALSLVVLVGFTGIVMDYGRLTVMKAELQNAADACALSAARELDGAADALTRAQGAGAAVATRNSVNFQSGAVALAGADMRFGSALSDLSGTNGNYQTVAQGAPATATYALCTARLANIGMTLSSVVGVGPQTLEASAVAQARMVLPACALPFGLCRAPFGLSHDQWFRILGYVCGFLRQPPFAVDPRLLDTLRLAMASVCGGGRLETVLVQ